MFGGAAAGRRNNREVCVNPGFYQCSECIGEPEEAMGGLELVSNVNSRLGHQFAFCWDRSCISEENVRGIAGARRAGTDYIVHPITRARLNINDYNNGLNAGDHCPPPAVVVPPLLPLAFS